MTRIFALVGLVSLFAFAYANAATSGVGTLNTTVTTASTKVLDANDLPTGRHYLFLQNLSATVQVTCTIGATAATATTGIQLPAGASYYAPSVTGAAGVVYGPPNGEIDCIAASTTASVTVISY